MGSFLFNRKKQIKIFLWGRGAGKTTILYRNILHKQCSVSFVGWNVETTTIKNNLVTFCELSGSGPKDFEKRNNYINESTDGVIYVIDSSMLDEDIICRNEFKNFMNIERIKQIPVAIFFHKQDIKEGRPSDEEIKKYYYFDEIPNNVNYKIFKTSSITGEGIDEGLNWLLDNIK